MPIISEINLFEQPVQHVLAVRTIIKFADYPKIAEQTFKKILEYLALNCVSVSGGPYVCYHNTDLENLDVELGFPVSKPIETDSSEIFGYTIPIRKVVSGIYLGAYEETDPLMMEIFKWLVEHNYKQQGGIYHYYLNNDKRPKNELLTEIAIPIN
jgi:effector-binding domain-containing protein